MCGWFFPLARPFPRWSYTPHIRRGTLNHNIFKCSFCTLITWWRVEDQNNNTRAAEETRRYRVLMQGKLTDRPHLNPLTTHHALYPNLWSIFHPKCVSCSFGFGSGFRAIFNVQHPTLLACNSSCGNQCAVLLFFAINDSNLSNYAFSAGTSENLVEWHEKNLIDIWFAFLDDQLVKYKLFSLTHHTQSDLFICFLIEINEPLDEAHKSSQPLLTPFPRCTHCRFTFQIIEITWGPLVKCLGERATHRGKLKKII